MVHPERKSINWMQDNPERFSTLSELPVDLLFGTFATARACSELLRHWRFAACKIDSKRSQQGLGQCLGHKPDSF